jgi:hypothetical protein
MPRVQVCVQDEARDVGVRLRSKEEGRYARSQTVARRTRKTNEFTCDDTIAGDRHYTWVYRI